MARDLEWRKKELSLDEVAAKFPDFPKLLILKIDVQRRGVIYTEAAQSKIDPDIHQVQSDGQQGFRIEQRYFPEGLILKDGSYLIVSYDYDFENQKRDPYVVDVIDDRIWITDEGRKLAEVSYFVKPDYYNKLASNGEPLTKYISSRPQRIDVVLNQYCHFWDRNGGGCKYCPLTPNYLKQKLKEERYNVKYIVEAVKEALKQEGRFSGFMFTGGSILSGDNVLDDELDAYIELIKAIGDLFEDGKRYPSQLISSAFDERQLERLVNETKLMHYTTDIEVLDREKFAWICEGKNHYIGYDEWKRRLIASIDYFGKGNVSSGMVLGVELASPNGFVSEEEAFKVITEEAETIVENGISLAANVWRPAPGSVFQNQYNPSLEYFVSVYNKFDELHHKYNVGRYTDDYRRCGMHPGLDLLRI